MLLVAMKIPPATTETWHSQINKSDDLKKQKIELFINTNESVIGGGGGGEGTNNIHARACVHKWP